MHRMIKHMAKANENAESCFVGVDNQASIPVQVCSVAAAAGGSWLASLSHRRHVQSPDEHSTRLQRSWWMSFH
jgi:hypothetical protein